MADGSGTTDRSSRPGLLPVKVSMVSNSVFFGKLKVPSRYRAERLLSKL